MKKRIGWILVGLVLAVLLTGGFFYRGFQQRHTITLAGSGAEQVQPLLSRVKVRGTQDTEVVFTDIETGERYVIGYITPGMSETIQLSKGRWYTVAGAGELSIGPVEVRIE